MSKILFFSNKPQAVFTYWLTSNCFSLGQVALLRHPFIRNKLRIPERIKHSASALPQNDGFIESMKKGECLHTHPILGLRDVWWLGFFSSVVKLWGQLICDANLLAQAGKTLSWPSSWKRGKGESKIIWTWRLKVSFTNTSSASQRQTFYSFFGFISAVGHWEAAGWSCF